MNQGHLFLPYELALKAKELSIPNNTASCFATWNDTEKRKFLHFGENTAGFIDAPLYQQLFDWMYSKFGIWITVQDNQHCDIPESGFQFYIDVYGFCEVGLNKNHYFRSQYEAYDKAIEIAFKLIEKGELIIN